MDISLITSTCRTKPTMNNNLNKYFLASIVETSHDSIITIDLDFAITSWNTAAEALYGYPAAEVLGKPLTTLTLPEDFQKLLEKIEKIKESRTVELFESERVGKNKAHMILEVVVSPVNDENGNLIGISTIARDLTARRVAEKAMRDKDVLHRLIIAQEDERSRISRDLHDELGQQLTALQFALARTKSACKDDVVCGYLDEVMDLTTAIDKSVDFLAWELRPALLERAGIAEAIENYARQWSEHSGVAAETLTSGLSDVRFAPNAETNLYRIVQEALNNTHKHASANRVEILLTKRGHEIVLMIADDGRGFSLKSKKNHLKGLGLTGMKERASLIGGTLDFESSPRKGTTVHVRLPSTAKRKRKAIKALSATDWGIDQP
jgi:PAS domain S-box-containing protein